MRGPERYCQENLLDDDENLLSEDSGLWEQNDMLRDASW
jgi:hypothetical protein